MVGTEATEHHLAIVRRVCLEWDTLTRDDWHELLRADCDYRNVPIEGDRHIGPDAVHDIIAPFGLRWKIEATIVAIAARENVVLTERIERFVHRKGTRPTFDLPIMGAFELRDRKIAAWRDYFELSQRRLR